MSKIRITESQYKVIMESDNEVEAFRELIEDKVEILNSQFARLAFASMADVMDEDIDIDVIEATIKDMTKYHNQKHEAIKWSTVAPDVVNELDEKSGVLMNKITGLSELLVHMNHIAKLDVEKHFSDIETRKR